MERSRRRASAPLLLLAAAVTAVAVVVVTRSVDTSVLAAAFDRVRQAPAALTVVATLYGGAFALRAWAWRRVVPQLGLGHALSAILLALGGNHLLPFRLGEVLRVTSVVRRAGIDPAVATASTVALRGADLAALAVLGAVLGLGILGEVSGPGAVVLVVVAIVLTAGGMGWLRRLAAADRFRGRMPGPTVAAASTAAWALEAAVLWQAAHWSGVTLTVPQAVLATVVTVAAQIAAVAPGGFGTYEAAGTAVLVAMGVPAPTALAIALLAHALKTGFSLAGGAFAAFVPSPGLLGRLRLPRRAPRRTFDPPPGGPVVLFLPAHDEEAAVADVVRRCPSEVCGRPVVCVVVDDGSADGTAAAAASAGATVVSHGRNRGLGAAVRTGFADAVARGAAAVAFCDADGEYAPEELERLVAPVLEGRADYVVGSRFAGDIRRMLPHRRFGNGVLTVWTRWVARAPITDGQSGYRALSRQAAAEAAIEHDFNYAQVLTLDLLARGYRYHEVPITYAFRTHGRSFVRLGRYLRNVVPAVWRTVNRAPDPVHG